MNEAFWGLSGVSWAVMGAALAAIGGGIGSAIGITTISNTASGIVTEDSEKFGRVLPLAAMPGTQGIYGLITAILVMVFFNILGASAEPAIAGETGFKIFLACLPVAALCLVSAIYQGMTAVGAAGMVARRSEDSGKALIFPALVETYAVFALITSILMLSSLASIYPAG
ncbi:MAG: V-type ATP synthase subunit K [Anaerosomatales bacterium]|nr:V-type ATP synthase subunit K [Anaerosomatales bacterium]